MNERKNKFESQEFPGFLATCMDPILKDAWFGHLINPNPAYFIVEDVDSNGKRYSIRYKSSNDRSNQRKWISLEEHATVEGGRIQEFLAFTLFCFITIVGSLGIYLPRNVPNGHCYKGYFVDFDEF